MTRTLLAFFLGLAGAVRAAEEVNIYSHRHYEIDKQLYQAFERKTGIKVNVLQASADQLIEKLKQEGERSPADLLMTADAGRLHRAQSQGLLQAVTSGKLDELVPAALREPAGHWFGLTVRSRVVACSKERVKPGELTRYEDLADPKWKGRVLATPSSTIYNQSLLASIIAANGEEKAKEWAKAVRGNMARPPQGNDRAQVQAVAAGLGDVAIVNTYYLGLLSASANADEKAAFEKVFVCFPNQADRGAHVNVSGAGVTKHAKHKENAVKLLEFLASEESQRVFAEANFEYPVNPANNHNALLKGWGEFKRDELNLAKLGELNAAAVRIFNEVGW